MKYEKMANGYGDTVESTIQHMVKIITSKFNPQSIILIGSHARGDANKHSDIDLLVVVDAVHTQPPSTYAWNNEI